MISRRFFSVSAPSLRGKLDKRIPVQLLKDFPGLGVRGEIVRVLPGRMRNELHMGNGAAYVLKGEPLKIKLVTREEAFNRVKAADELDAAEQARLEHLEQERLRRRSTTRQTSEEEMREALKNLAGLDLDLKIPSKQQPQQQQSAASTETTSSSSSSSSPLSSSSTQEQQQAPTTYEELAESDLYFLESSLKSLPKILLVKAEIAPDGFVASKKLIHSKTIAPIISNLLGMPIDPSLIHFPVPSSTNKNKNNKDSSSPTFASGIDFVGVHSILFKLPNGREVVRMIRVVPTNAADLDSWETFTRPRDVPYPGTESHKKDDAVATESTKQQQEKKDHVAEPAVETKKEEPKTKVNELMGSLKKINDESLLYQNINKRKLK